MNAILNSFIEESQKGLSQTILENPNDECFTIDCSKLGDYLTADVRDSAYFHDMFKKLKKIEKSAIYWFKIVSDVDNSSIINTFKQYKDINDSRPTPALNNYNHTDSRTLYVGKVQGCLWGRIIQHLGYHKDLTDHGLQLYHWSKSLPLILELHVISVNSEMDHLLPSLEIYFAKQLKPLIGKH